jgi:hypothetical protein
LLHAAVCIAAVRGVRGGLQQRAAENKGQQKNSGHG